VECLDVTHPTGIPQPLIRLSRRRLALHAARAHLVQFRHPLSLLLRQRPLRPGGPLQVGAVPSVLSTLCGERLLAPHVLES
jgi:hypothetical protein